MGTLVLGLLSRSMWTALLTLLVSSVLTFIVSPTCLLLFLLVLAMLRRSGQRTLVRLTLATSRCMACITTMAPDVPTSTIMPLNRLPP